MTDTLPAPDTASRIMAALSKLNETYGRGTLASVDYSRSVFCRREFSGRLGFVTFIVSPDGSQVFACGHWAPI